MRLSVFCVCVVSLVASSVAANPPHPPNCICTLDNTARLYISPDLHGTWQHPLGEFTIELYDVANFPVMPSAVRVAVDGQVTNHISLCPTAILSQSHISNVYTFNIPGSGCYRHQPGAVVIEADDLTGNWVTIRSYLHIMSSDYDGWDNIGLPGRWDGCVNPADLAAFVRAFAGGVGPSSCHDYDNDGATAPQDLAYFVAAYVGGINCCP